MFLLLLTIPGLSWSASPAILNYQGKLSDSDGNPTTATVPMVFGIYSAATGGAPLFTDTRAGVPVSNGIFNVLIGTGTLGGSIGDLIQTVQTNTTLYLQVTVNGTPLTPRQQLVASPFSLAVAGLNIDAANNRLGVGVSPSYSLDISGDINLTGQLRQNGTPAVFSNWTVTGSDIYRNSRVRIGSAVAPAYVLDVTGSAQVSSSMTVTGNGLSGASPVFQVVGGTMTVLANGNVGIGTTTPGYRMDVVGNARISGLGGGGTQMVVADNTGILSAQAIPGGGSPVSGSGSASRLAFWTSGSAISYNANFYWDDSNARLGIGTTSPSQKLHVAGDAVVNGGMQFGANSAYINGYDTVNPFIELMVGDTGSGNTYGHGLILRRARTGTGATNWGNIGMINDTTLGIGTLNAIGTSNNILAIDSSGYVGIGTTSPDYRLDVSGDINLTGQLRQNGTPAVFSNWTITGSDLYRNSKVRVGNNTAPTYTMDVYGTLGLRSDGANSGELKVNYTGSAPAGYYATYAP